MKGQQRSTPDDQEPEQRLEAELAHVHSEEETI